MSTRDRSELLDAAAKLHREGPIIDGHVDVLPELSVDDLAGNAEGRSQFDLERARIGGLSGAVLTVHASPARRSPENDVAGRAEHDKRYTIITGLAERHPDLCGLARTPGEALSLIADGRFAVILGFQNAGPLGTDLDALDRWAERGIQIFAFTFIGNNQWADSSRPYPYIESGFAGGLTELGRRGVRRLNELGIIVDVSQLSSAAFADVISVSRAPVLASHSGVRVQVDTDRNFSDAELKLLASNGGLLQAVGFGPYVAGPAKPVIQELVALWRRYGLTVSGSLSDLLSVNDPATADWDDERFWTFLHEFHLVLDLNHPAATTADLTDTIDHAVQQIGIDHVGISSDFNHAGGLADWIHVGQTLNVTAELLNRGYTGGDVAKLWGQNFLGLWERIASGLRT